MTLTSSRLGYNRAQKAFYEAQTWYAQLRFDEALVEDRRARSRARDFREFLRRTVQPGIYEHWKSAEDDQKFYAVLGVDFDITTPGAFDPPAVRYYALYGAEAGKAVRRSLLHPKDGFLSPISRPDDPEHPYVGPRFRYRKSVSPADLLSLVGRNRRFARIKTRAGIERALSQDFLTIIL